DDVVAMSRDVRGYAQEFGVGSPSFADGLAFQLAARNLSEAAVFTTSPKGITIIAATGLDSRPMTNRIQPRDLVKAGAGPLVIASSGDRIEAVVRLDAASGRYLYASRKVDPQVLNQVARTATALSEYKSLIERSRLLQWRFNLIMVVVSLIILAVAIWFALWLANRLVTPIGALADAAERVGAGDLDARVPVRGATDEIATLSRAFNRMTGQLKAQQSALVSANSQLDRRRQFTEAVLSGVSAGVLSVDSGGFVRLANQSAAELLQSTEGALAGTRLRDVVPELSDLLDVATQTGTASGQVRIARGNDTQTLVVQIAAETGAFHADADADGHGQSLVVTFDDISEQLADQRSAAWADVARRIAHEIKNPLTPIQLSAERLQRKYGPQITSDPEIFASLTGTIVRQVGDLRRMVDEFSEFARMPKPVFRTESVLDLMRQTLFLHEVGYPTITFALDAPADLPGLECDRRQITQALTNLLKNAAESVLARVEADALHAEQSGGAATGVTPGKIVLAARQGTGNEAGQLIISITDNGIGLPVEQRDRLTEPYVTTRARGTGLGLAIVKKIVEEHGGTLELGDAPADGETGRGAVARLHFDLAAAARLHVDRLVHPVTVPVVQVGSPAPDTPAQATIIQFKQQG
ncbi:MAG TPA: ATP-binding protein, partial [Polymorphobacter sp.]|nr:ATP-binding protein [Polymorphobacter sp.]